MIFSVSKLPHTGDIEKNKIFLTLKPLISIVLRITVKAGSLMADPVGQDVSEHQHTYEHIIHDH